MDSRFEIGDAMYARFSGESEKGNYLERKRKIPRYQYY